MSKPDLPYFYADTKGQWIILQCPDLSTARTLAASVFVSLYKRKNVRRATPGEVAIYHKKKFIVYRSERSIP